MLACAVPGARPVPANAGEPSGDRTRDPLIKNAIPFGAFSVNLSCAARAMLPKTASNITMILLTF